jgi:hypothetical protein
LGVAYAHYEASSLASGVAFVMFFFPDGAGILLGYLAPDALGGSSSLVVGPGACLHADGTSVAGVVDEFYAAAASTSALGVDVVDPLALGSGFAVDAGGDGYHVTVTMGGAAGSGSIVLTMFYVVD